MKLRLAALALSLFSAWSQAAALFPLTDVRLKPGPFLDAQTTDLHYMMAMEPDRLLAPFLREAGLAPRQPSYGNWESTGLDGHMGGHYLSALALMYAATGDAEVLRRLNYMVAELKRAQTANGDGYLGGIPGGRQAWRDIAAGKLAADNFSVNGKWVPWYNLHKVYAGLRDAWRYAGNEDARAMLVALSDWALRLTSQLSEAQMQQMLRSEHGGMNEIFADVAEMTGDRTYLELALRFSHQAVLQPLAQGQDQLTGLHANTQIPKVIGFKRIADMTGRADLDQAARFFWQTVVTRFPDQGSTRLSVETPGTFTMKIRYPGWVASGMLVVKVNGRAVKIDAAPGSYVSIARDWRKGDRVDVQLPMTTRLEQMPDKSNYYAVLHGPIVLAAKTRMFGDEQLNFLADASRMGHIAGGPVCPLESAPMLVSDSTDFLRRFHPVKGKPLTFTAPGLVHGAAGSATEFIPFFRLHESRYTMYWQHATPANFERMRAENAAREAARLALDARTIDQVAPGEQQPEADHFFKGEGIEAGVNGGRHWRHASKWFSYELKDPKGEAKLLRLSFARADAGRRFDIEVNGVLLAEVVLAGDVAQEFYTVDYPLPASLLQARPSALSVRFVAKPGSVAGGLYGLRLLR